MDKVQRLETLREEMQREHLSAVIIPTTDSHLRERTTATVVVTMKEHQLMEEENALAIAEWLSSPRRDMEGTEVAIDGNCCSIRMVKQLVAELRRHGGMTLRTNFDPLRFYRGDGSDDPISTRNGITQNRPHDWPGESALSKLTRIRQALHEQHADGMLMARLDDIAWTLNLQDTEFVGYLLISSKSATLYINNKENLPPLGETLHVEKYEQVKNGLKKYFEYNILMDPDEVNYALYDFLKREGVRREGVKSPVRIVEETSPVPALTTHH
jgi:Xaa-Pro aminopeptidase